MAKIIAVVNQKGGVGKTTTAVNLAAALGIAERRVLLVDVDPQGNATSGLGVDASAAAEKQIYHVLLGDCPVEAAIQSTEVPNLSILPSSADLIGFEVEAVGLPYRERILERKLTPLRSTFDFILVDCPPSLSLLTVNALTASDHVLVPLQAEYYALEGLGRLIGTVEMLRQQLNPTLSILGILLTMFDRRNSLAHQVAQEVETHFPKLLWRTRIPRNVKLSEAPSFGKSVLMYDIRSVGAQSYLSLAEEFLARLRESKAGEVEPTPIEIGGVDAREESTGTGASVPHPDTAGQA